MPQPKEQRCVADDGGVRFHREKPSRRLAKTVLDPTPRPIPGIEGVFYHWENDLYYGTLRSFEAGSAFDNGPYKIIGITALAEDARHDWREFQQIKNDLAGEEWEAVEFYPAESRLVDPSNRFYLWCFPPGTVLSRIGFLARSVVPPQNGGAPQRPFPE